MKAREVNISVIDLSESKNSTIDLSKLPSEEEIRKKIKSELNTLKKEGIVEIEVLNITLIDLSEAEGAKIE
ncbi:MAG: hypothetical protein KJI71_05745 [Patescibacteria group bacterium]|nr:hypothetical protein [Patescibacteria group bacterium]